MLDGLVEHVERLPRTLVQELVEEEGEPGAEHLLRHALRAPEQELGVGLALHAPLNQVRQQRFQDVRAVLHPKCTSNYLINVELFLRVVKKIQTKAQFFFNSTKYLS